MKTHKEQIADQIKETRATLRKVPVSLRGGFHQMGARYAKDASMWLARGNIEMASTKSLDAKFQAERAVAMLVWV
jgi:hypothetical protein